MEQKYQCHNCSNIITSTSTDPDVCIMVPGAKLNEYVFICRACQTKYYEAQSHKDKIKV